ncbi:MAG: DUF1737 domain-containing protein [Bacteroidetes bacterium]|nr:DUF1737 domain-containing protein [Bacteroidota bacterium]
MNKPQKYETKTTSINAMQLTDSNAFEVCGWVGREVTTQFIGGTISIMTVQKYGVRSLHVSVGEYLIKSPTGDFQTMALDDFNSQYTLTEDSMKVKSEVVLKDKNNTLLEYTILSHPIYTSDRKLQYFVNNHLKNGWMLQGGVSAVLDTNGHLYLTQAMVREVKK